MPKLCKCGAIVERRCDRCYPATHSKTTTQRGYDYQHKVASERYRAERPLCECCVLNLGVIGARPTTSMHHVVKIANDPSKRMQRSNWLAVCDECHELLEHDESLGMKVKAWSDEWYEIAMHLPCRGHDHPSGGGHKLGG